ncbi:MAG: Flp pilus assembly protein CpaB [Eggerthellaceae bacterium]|nr:Flp pilus assembly protein CpaB [Eggerthellaceae bacterium]
MRKKATTVIALLCGAICAASVFMYTQTVEARAEAQRSEALARYGGDQVEVCVATRDISPGEIADTSNTMTRLWLVDLLPDEPLTSLSEVAGMQATSLILAGEVLSHARFEGTSARVVVPSGLQAVGVELGSAQAVGGALDAGSLVDVYVVGSSGTSRIAQNVLVASLSEQGSGRFSVTLAIDPEKVEEVIAATQTATLYLTLPARGEGE